MTAGLVEGDSGTSTLNFAVSLVEASGSPLSIDYTTADGSATIADGDYQAASGTLNFNPGEPLTQTISVVVNGDTRFEANEELTLRLLNPVQVAIERAEGTGTISNDDVPSISITNALEPEGNRFADSTLRFVVTLEANFNDPVSIDFSTVDGTATVADFDYIPVSGTLYFDPTDSVTEQEILVRMVGDIQPESDEIFSLS